MTIKWELDLTGIATIGAAVIALLAVLVALWQLSAMLSQTRLNTLLVFDERWEREPMLSTRQDLWNFIRQVRQDVQNRWSALPEAELRLRSSEIYATTLQEMRTEDPGRFFRLFEICGFFETVGYVAKAGYIPVADTIGLFGVSIKELGRVFKPYIQKRHRAGGEPTEFECFLWLVDEEEKVM